MLDADTQSMSLFYEPYLSKLKQHIRNKVDDKVKYRSYKIWRSFDRKALLIINSFTTPRKKTSLATLYGRDHNNSILTKLEGYFLHYILTCSRRRHKALWTLWNIAREWIITANNVFFERYTVKRKHIDTHTKAVKKKKMWTTTFCKNRYAWCGYSVDVFIV